MALDADFPIPDSEDETPPSRRRGIATRPDFDTVTSVSGGSITAAQRAIAAVKTPSLRGGERKASDEVISPFDFIRDIARQLQALTSRDIRTGAMAKKFLLPWNWFRGAFVIDAMIDKFEEAFGKGTLNLLPDHPRFVFCGTDMAFGANFIFERDRVGSYLAGYAPKYAVIARRSSVGLTTKQSLHRSGVGPGRGRLPRRKPGPSASTPFSSAASRRSSARCAPTAPPSGSKEAERKASEPMSESRSSKTCA